MDIMYLVFIFIGFIRCHALIFLPQKYWDKVSTLPSSSTQMQTMKMLIRILLHISNCSCSCIGLIWGFLPSFMQSIEINNVYRQLIHPCDMKHLLRNLLSHTHIHRQHRACQISRAQAVCKSVNSTRTGWVCGFMFCSGTAWHGTARHGDDINIYSTWNVLKSSESDALVHCRL